MVPNLALLSADWFQRFVGSPIVNHCNSICFPMHATMSMQHATVFVAQEPIAKTLWYHVTRQMHRTMRLTDRYTTWKTEKYSLNPCSAAFPTMLRSLQPKLQNIGRGKQNKNYCGREQIKYFILVQKLSKLPQLLGNVEKGFVRVETSRPRREQCRLSHPTASVLNLAKCIQLHA